MSENLKELEALIEQATPEELEEIIERLTEMLADAD